MYIQSLPIRIYIHVRTLPCTGFKNVKEAQTELYNLDLRRKPPNHIIEPFFPDNINIADCVLQGRTNLYLCSCDSLTPLYCFLICWNIHITYMYYRPSGTTSCQCSKYHSASPKTTWWYKTQVLYTNKTCHAMPRPFIFRTLTYIFPFFIHPTTECYWSKFQMDTQRHLH